MGRCPEARNLLGAHRETAHWRVNTLQGSRETGRPRRSATVHRSPKASKRDIHEPVTEVHRMTAVIERYLDGSAFFMAGQG